jgi:hypothetical protein
MHTKTTKTTTKHPNINNKMKKIAHFPKIKLIEKQ